MAGKIFDHLKEKIFREDILNRRHRPDGRRFSEIRPISIEVGWLPRAHGSALFTRGETQAIVTATLGTNEDVQYMDDLEKGEVKRRFLLAYNFPHFSVGETGRFGSHEPPRDRPRRSRAPGARTVCFPAKPTGLTPFASFPTSPNPTVRARWRRCAAARLR